jgi:hypothetical protein
MRAASILLVGAAQAKALILRKTLVCIYFDSLGRRDLPLSGEAGGASGQSGADRIWHSAQSRGVYARRWESVRGVQGQIECLSLVDACDKKTTEAAIQWIAAYFIQTEATGVPDTRTKKISSDSKTNWEKPEDFSQLVLKPVRDRGYYFFFTAFRAAGFFAAGFLAAAFFTAFRAAGFFAAGFFAAGFLAAAFFTAFRAAGFFAAGFLAAAFFTAFRAAGFLAAAFLAGAFLAGAFFLSVGINLPPFFPQMR